MFAGAGSMIMKKRRVARKRSELERLADNLAAAGRRAFVPIIRAGEELEAAAERWKLPELPKMPDIDIPVMQGRIRKNKRGVKGHRRPVERKEARAAGSGRKR